MLDLLAFLVATAVQSAPEKDGAGEARAAATAPQIVTETTTATETTTETAPLFLAPATDGNAAGGTATEETAAAPAFLGATTGGATTQEAQPSFLGSTSTATAAVQQPVLQAEPQVPSGRFTTAVEVKPILSLTKANWISVREFNGEDLLYVTHLWSWRCGLLEIKVGVNGETPQIWPMPQCHEAEATPNAIKEGDGLPYRNYGLGQIALIEVQLTYDDLTTESAKFNRQGIPLQ